MLKYAIAGFATASFVIGVFYYGKHVGHTEGRIAQLEDIIEAEKKRGEIDAEVQNLDDYALCLRVVRLPEQCEQLRGVDAAPAD